MEVAESNQRDTLLTTSLKENESDLSLVGEESLISTSGEGVAIGEDNCAEGGLEVGEDEGGGEGGGCSGG